MLLQTLRKSPQVPQVNFAMKISMLHSSITAIQHPVHKKLDIWLNQLSYTLNSFGSTKTFCMFGADVGCIWGLSVLYQTVMSLRTKLGGIARMVGGSSPLPLVPKTNLMKCWNLGVKLDEYNNVIINSYYGKRFIITEWERSAIFFTFFMPPLYYWENYMQAFPWEACDRTRTLPHTPEEPKACDSSHA